MAERADITSDDGSVYYLWQDGDLWAVPMDTSIPGDNE